MSAPAATAATKGVTTRLAQAFGLVVTFGVLYGVTRFAPASDSPLTLIAGIGFLLLAGTLTSELLETVGLPHLTGYLLAGVLGGPHVLHLVDHATVEALSPVNAMALALIALAGGAELRLETLRRTAKSLAWATLLQSALVLLAMTGTFFLLGQFVPFTASLTGTQLVGVAFLWGLLAVTRSPSACMGILAQTRAKGPLATFALAFVMLSDVVVVLLLAVVMTLVRPLLGSAEGMSLDDFARLGHEILGSVAMGTTFGLALAIYLRLVGKQLLLVLLGIGFVLTEALRYVHAEPLLTFMTAGFVVQNFTAQGKKLLHAAEQTAAVVFVVFFGTAGAHLNVPLLRELWPVALALAGARGLFTYGASRLSSHLAKDEPVVARWAFAPLISQAGLTLGIILLIGRAFPDLDSGFAALAIAVVAVNEIVGPVLFKLALDRTGETDTDSVESRAGLDAEAGEVV